MHGTPGKSKLIWLGGLHEKNCPVTSTMEGTINENKGRGKNRFVVFRLIDNNRMRNKYFTKDARDIKEDARTDYEKTCSKQNK